MLHTWPAFKKQGMKAAPYIDDIVSINEPLNEQ